jgi:hypothetical protein
MVDATRLNRGEEKAVSVLAGATHTLVVSASRAAELVVQVEMTGDADAHLTVAVHPYVDNVVSNASMTAVDHSGPTAVSNVIRYYGRFDVLGVDKVAISCTNNDSGTLIINYLTWGLSQPE